MAVSFQTPVDLVIKPRNVMFGRNRKRARWWKDGDPVATAFYNSLSAVFPAGEAFFIDSVRYYRDRLEPSLQAQVDAFIKQEAVHSREHGHFNKQLSEAGYDLTQIRVEEEEFQALVKEQPPDLNLAITVATEHLTAIFAHALLASARHFKGDAPELAQLWKWHAIEEVEHKAVAYDTFVAVTRELSRFERWKFRSMVMLLVAWDFVTERLRFMGYFFEQDGIKGPRTWLRTAYFLLVYPGIFRQIFPAWLSFFRPGFHPWQHDDRDLIDKTEAQLALRLVGQTAGREE
jgi:uncharacterized protein